MDIEVAAKTPEDHKVFINPVDGLTSQQADDISRSIGIVESAAEKRTLLLGLYHAFDSTDASLAESTLASMPTIMCGTRRKEILTTTRFFVTLILSRCVIWMKKIRQSKHRTWTIVCPTRRQHRLLVNGGTRHGDHGYHQTHGGNPAAFWMSAAGYRRKVAGHSN